MDLSGILSNFNDHTTDHTVDASCMLTNHTEFDRSCIISFSHSFRIDHAVSIIIVNIRSCWSKLEWVMLSEQIHLRHCQ